MSDNTPTFDFDAAPASGQTLTDQQPERDSGGGGNFSDFDDEVVDNTPKKAVKCRAVMAKPNKWSKDGAAGVAVNFTASEGDHAGFEAPMFLTLKGAPAKVARGKQDLAKLCRKLGIDPTGTTSALLDQVADKAGEEVEVNFKPANNGGMFVNM